MCCLCHFQVCWRQDVKWPVVYPYHHICYTSHVKSRLFRRSLEARSRNNSLPTMISVYIFHSYATHFATTLLLYVAPLHVWL